MKLLARIVEGSRRVPSLERRVCRNSVLEYRSIWLCWFSVKWRNRGWELRCTELTNRARRFVAFVPIPKGKTGRHRAALLRSWSLGRRSGRVTTEPYPPPRPLSIVEARQTIHNDLRQPHRAGRHASRAFCLLSRAVSSLRSRSSKIACSRPASLAAGAT